MDDEHSVFTGLKLTSRSSYLQACMIAKDHLDTAFFAIPDLKYIIIVVFSVSILSELPILLSAYRSSELTRPLEKEVCAWFLENATYQKKAELFCGGYSQLDASADALKIQTNVLNVLERPALL